MANKFIYRLILFIVLFTARPLMGMANDRGLHVACIISDTIPPAKKPAEAESEKTKPAIIKEVPKARKQVKPIALPPVVPIKPPVKIIRPIIKRVI